MSDGEKLDWVELSDGSQMAVTDKGTYFVKQDPFTNEWVLSVQRVAPKEI